MSAHLGLVLFSLENSIVRATDRFDSIFNTPSATTETSQSIKKFREIRNSSTH